MSGAGVHIGELVRSLAGHDKGEYFIVLRQSGDFVWLCDGKNRKALKPKKKKLKHIEPTGKVNKCFAKTPESMNNTSVRNAIKQMNEAMQQ